MKIEKEEIGKTLSQREQEVMGYLAQGYSNKQIARKLTLSQQTVKNHVGNLFRKLGVGNRTEAALLAVGVKVNSPGLEVLRGTTSKEVAQTRLNNSNQN
jgi:DNA-binding NarL/FixJ family response regulator